MRLDKHPILDFNRKKKIQFDFEGETIYAFEGEPIAAALHAAGKTSLSESVRFQRARGLYCAIGKCASCVMEVNGVPNVRTCIEPAVEGMQVRMQSRAEISANARQNTIAFSDPEFIETDFAVIGGGPAGISAAIYAARSGIRPLVIEENFLLGGQLIKQTHKFFGSRSHYASVRGIDIAEKLLTQAQELNVEFWTSASVIGFYPDNILGVVYRGRYFKVKAKTVLVATGASEKTIAFPGNDLPGVYGAGAIQTLMNVYGIMPGRKVLMVGAGNIGVIVAYQLIQAGVEVVGVCEAMPRVGAYLVHSAKLLRLGVPIYTSHTVARAWGQQHLEGVEIQAVDSNWQPVAGSSRTFDVDTLGLAVGLSPSVEILSQGGAEMRYIPELGGTIALHDHSMETTLPGVYVAGDISGIEEASAAMMEGRIAGLSAAMRVNGSDPDTEKLLWQVKDELAGLRDGPFGEKIRQGNLKVKREAKKYGMR